MNLDFLRSMFGSSARQAGVASGGSFQGKVGLSPDLNPAMAPQMADPGQLTRAPTMAQPEPGKRPSMSWGDRARIFAVGLGDTGAAAKLRGQIDAGSKQEALIAQAKELGLTPNEMFLLQLDPEVGAGLLKERWSPYTLSQGSVRGQQGEAIHSAPVLGESGGHFYKQDADGVKLQGQRPQSYAEETSRELGQERVDAMRDRYEALERDAEARRGLAERREGRIGAGGGKPKAPPAGFLIDP